MPPEETSHFRTRPSSPQVTTTLPSGLQSRPRIAAGWPPSDMYGAPDSPSHTCSPPPRSAVASSTPSGLYATAVTQSVCFTMRCTNPPSPARWTLTIRDGPPIATRSRGRSTSQARTSSTSAPTLATSSPVDASHTLTPPEGRRIDAHPHLGGRSTLSVRPVGWARRTFRVTDADCATAARACGACPGMMPTSDDATHVVSWRGPCPRANHPQSSSNG